MLLVMSSQCTPTCASSVACSEQCGDLSCRPRRRVLELAPTLSPWRTISGAFFQRNPCRGLLSVRYFSVLGIAVVKVQKRGAEGKGTVAKPEM
jgi:hypothetical protein